MFISGVFQCNHGLKEAFAPSVISVLIYHSQVQLILNIVSMVTEYVPLFAVLAVQSKFLNYK